MAEIPPTHKGGQGKLLNVPTRRVEFNVEFWGRGNESTDNHPKIVNNFLVSRCQLSRDY